MISSQNIARVSLKGYKEHKELSEETTAYTTKICIDGQVVGEARNDGHGGCDRIHILPESDALWSAIVDEWASLNTVTFEVESAFIADLAKVLAEKKVAARLMRKDERITTVVAVDVDEQKISDMAFYGSTVFYAYAAVTGERMIADIQQKHPAGNPFRLYPRDAK